MKLLNDMSYKKINHALLLFSLCLFFTCSKGGDDAEPPTKPPTAEVNDPTAATLVFPIANSECTEGTNVTATESTILFQWNKGNHKTSYNLQLKDLKAGTTTSYSTVENSYSIKLKRGNPYAWSIISRSNKTSVTASTSTWKFFNAGEGVSSYAPFPADAVSPVLGESVTNGAITLEWDGNDIDNDIESYNIYFGETTSPVEYKTDVTVTTVENVVVEAGKTYYWSVSTKDEQGNISNSDVFSFKGI